MKKVLSFVFVLILLMSVTSGAWATETWKTGDTVSFDALAETAAPFEDVTQSSPYHDAIVYLDALDTIPQNGTQYHAEATMTHEEFLLDGGQFRGSHYKPFGAQS